MQKTSFKNVLLNLAVLKETKYVAKEQDQEPIPDVLSYLPKTHTCDLCGKEGCVYGKVFARNLNTGIWKTKCGDCMCFKEVTTSQIIGK